MRPATLLFYAFATFSLGTTALALGAARVLSDLLRMAPEAATLAFLVVTVTLAGVYVVLALFYIVTRDPTPPADDD